MNYRRARVSGGTWFFTVVTHGRQPLFGSDENVEILKRALDEENSVRPFSIDAIAILPDHLHCIWTLPEGDNNFSTRWRRVKTRVSQSMGGGTPAKIWQNRFWEHLVRDEIDFERHADYIHYNPVRHGYVSLPGDWPYSSFHDYAARGIYPPGWGARSPASRFNDLDCNE
jgi:putative transposase